MNKGVLIRLFTCILFLGGFLYAYINQQNEITELRLEIPLVARELKKVQQENVRLQFEIDRFEDPLHLIELARQPQYRHLKHPLLKEIKTITVPSEGL